MKQLFQQVWADPVGRVALVVAVASTIPAWFIWPGEPLMEGVDSLIVAGFFVALWSRGLLGEMSGPTAAGIAAACVGLVVEAGFWLATDDCPTVVALVFPIGLLIALASALTYDRRAVPQG